MNLPKWIAVIVVLVTSICASLTAAGAQTPLLGACGEPATLIHDVQGAGLTSPLVGMQVVIEGIVVGDFQNNSQADNGNLSGFFVQEEDADVDANQATSEGIFVFAPGSTGTDVRNGDKVRVRGTVAEFNGVTEITNVSGLLQCSPGNSLPTPPTVPLRVT